MKDYAMKIRVNGKDHALSSGPRVALPGLLRDRLMLTGMKKSHNRQYMTNAGTETGTPTFPFLSDHGGEGTPRSPTEEGPPPRPQGGGPGRRGTPPPGLGDPAGARPCRST